MSLSEFTLIERYFQRASMGGREDVVLGIGDDAALLQPPGDEALVVAVDTLVAGRHFPLDSPAAAVGHKALAVNLSDLAAMGAQPLWFTLSLTLPEAQESYLEPFATAILTLAEKHRVALVGGDTVRGPHSISVQIMGSVPQGEALRRSGARVGDCIFVSGSLGDAAAGLALLPRRGESASIDRLLARLEYPTPRVELGLALRTIASAAIDISDGLAADLDHILEQSGVAARVDIEALPLSQELSQHFNTAEARRYALCGGDDYELCFTVPVAMRERVVELSQEIGLPLSEIGRIEAGSGLTLAGEGAAELTTCHGFDHFSGEVGGER